MAAEHWVGLGIWDYGEAGGVNDLAGAAYSAAEEAGIRRHWLVEHLPRQDCRCA